MLTVCLALLAVPAADPAATPAFVLHAAGAEPVRGALQAVDAGWTVRLDAGRTAGADLIALRRTDRKLPPFPAGPQITFANGDRLPGEVLSIENGQVRFRAQLGDPSRGADAQDLTVPLSALAEVWFQSPAESSRPRAGERRRRDVVTLSNGDTRTGTVVAMKSHAHPLTLQEGSKELRVEPRHVVVIAMNTDLARTLRPREPFARAVLANGTRLSLLTATADDHALTGKTLFGAEVRIAVDQVVALDVLQGKAVYLSDLKPAKYDHTPYLGVRWPFEPDRSVAGHELRLDGHTFDKGVGLHSESRLTYTLAGRYRRFEATVGLDDRTGQGGDVRVRVLVDGAEKGGSDAALTAATGPRAVRTEVTGAKELTLVVEFGGGGDVCDHVNWADARLVK